MDRLQEIEARKLEIRELLQDETKEVNIDELKQEVENLDAEKKQIEDAVEEKQENENTESEERKNVAKAIEERNIQPKEIEINKEERKMDNVLESKEYRSAFLKGLQGKELTVEERAVITENDTHAIPTETENSIFAKVAKKAPMLDEITLLNVRGNVDFVVETARTDGADHAEGASITEGAINLTKVSLAGTEIVKLVTISESVKTMTIDAFEGWLTDMLADSIANAVEGKIIATIEGSGTTSSATTLDADGIRTVIGELPASYDAGAKFICNKKKFFTQILGLQDNAKNDIVTFSNGKYYIYGYEVLTSDKSTKLVLVNAKKFVANMPQSIQVKSAYNIANNTYSYSGVAMYDGKLAVADSAIVLTESV